MEKIVDLQNQIDVRERPMIDFIMAQAGMNTYTQVWNVVRPQVELGSLIRNQVRNKFKI